MANGDYGYFGKGDSGYAHYTQTFNSTMHGSRSGSSHSSSSGTMPTRKEIEQMTPEERQKLNDNLDASLRKTSIYLAIAIVVLFFIFAR